MPDPLAFLNRIGLAASSSRFGGIFYHVVCRRIDTLLIPLSGGRLSLGPPGQTVLMTTTGARTGKPRKAVVAFTWLGEEMVVIASKGGAAHHSAWYHNMKANPSVRTQYNGIDEERVAREALGPERDKLYEQMTASFSNFESYQKRATGRRIPVMLLAKTSE
jgi:deazaflavin-dependent oxidoreductase (nitroreductase family)